MYVELDNYYKNWDEYYSDNNGNIKKIKLLKLLKNKSWFGFFESESKKKYFSELESFLTEKVADYQKNIFPYPELVFYPFNLLNLNEVRVVIIGQDPYFNKQPCKGNKYPTLKGKKFPEAMGLSFSVPDDIKIPSSLSNIFTNMVKFNHINSIPENGDLVMWLLQGCLMFNSTLTVDEGTQNSHKSKWLYITNELIKYISYKLDFVVFVLWGADALKKKILINEKKHKIIISSHPSGLSCSKPLGEYPAFKDQDHFGLINKYINKYNKFNNESIDWKLI
jgi:uracil-DNA glycosylase